VVTYRLTGWELICLTKVQREELLQEAQLPVVIQTSHALAIKADLSIPWNKLRILRRYPPPLKNASLSTNKAGRMLAAHLELYM
jgi:hypothetical protein